MSLLFNTLSRFVIEEKSFNFVAAVTIRSDFGAQENKVCHCFHLFIVFPSICHEMMWVDAMILVFWILRFKPAFSPSSFTFIRGSLFPLHFLPWEWHHLHYLKLLMFLPPILIPACNSSSPAFLMMCSAYRLNKQGDSIQPCCTPFSIFNQSIVPYRVLTVASWPAYKFLRRQVRWSGIPISLRACHCLLWSTQSKALV